MTIYRLTDVRVLGDKDEKWGYTYWCKVEGDNRPVKFNSHKTFENGNMVGTEEPPTIRKTQKGQDYIALKAVKALETATESILQPETVQQTAPAQKPATEPVRASQQQITVSGDVAVMERLERIEAKLDKLLGNDEQLAQPAKDTVYPVTSEPVDLNDLPEGY